MKIAQYATQCLNTIENAGYEAYIVGGAVRDILMGITPADYDIATNAPPEAIIPLFSRIEKTGIKHGTVTVITDIAPIEVTTYRGESGYSDGRHPDSVHFISSLEEDLMRRDFTINAMAYNPRTDIIDLFGGKDDIKRGVLRAVGEPKKRFTEDALRIMRLFRFACKTNFTIEPETYAAAIDLCGTLSAISAERIFSELSQTLCSANPQNIAPLILAGGLSHLGLTRIQTPDRLQLISPLRENRFAAFCILCNTNTEFLNRLKADNALIKFVDSLFEFAKHKLCTDDYSARYILSLFSDQTIFGGLEIKNIIFGEDVLQSVSLIQSAINANSPRKICDLAVSGNDIAALGYKDRQIGEKLEYLLQQVILDPKKNNKDTLLNLIK